MGPTARDGASAAPCGRLGWPRAPGDVVDRDQWTVQLLDLHEAMSAIRALFLQLEHHSEALLRVGVEMVTCKEARGCLRWHDDEWFSDDVKREWFRKALRDKLAQVLQMLGRSTESQALDTDAAREALESKAAELQGALQEATAKRIVAEQRCAQLEAASAQSDTDARSQIASLERVNAQLRAQLKEAMKKDWKPIGPPQAKRPGSPSKSSAAGETKEGREAREAREAKESRDFKEAKEAKEAAEVDARQKAERLAEAEGRLRAFEEQRRRLEAELERAQRRADEHAQQAKVAQQQLAASAASAASQERQGGGQPGVDTAGRPEPELQRLRDELQLERSRSAELAAALAAAQQGIGTQPTGPGARSRGSGDQQRGAIAVAEVACQAGGSVGSANKSRPTTSSSSEVISESALGGAGGACADGAAGSQQKKTGEISRLKAIIVEKDEEIELLQSKMQRMAVMLHNLREQLKSLAAIAARKGCRKLVQDIMDESQVTETLNSDEFSWVARLYEDALRRQRKLKEIEERMHLGYEERSPTASQWMLSRAGKRPMWPGVSGGSGGGVPDASGVGAGGADPALLSSIGKAPQDLGRTRCLSRNMSCGELLLRERSAQDTGSGPSERSAPQHAAGALAARVGQEPALERHMPSRSGLSSLALDAGGLSPISSYGREAPLQHKAFIRKSASASSPLQSAGSRSVVRASCGSLLVGAPPLKAEGRVEPEPHARHFDLGTGLVGIALQG